MAGHNKWSKVKHIKARVDVIRGKVFSKCAHEIAIAARDGGGDPTMNARLRAAIDSAKAVSMPKDNIERAIKKGTGELGGDAIQEVTYEGYGSGGAAYIVEAATDNLNRTAADIRSIFSKAGGSVATPGSVSYQFDRKGEIRYENVGSGEDRLMELVIEAGGDELENDGDEWVVLTAPTELFAVSESLRGAGLEPKSEKLVSLPQNVTMIDDLEQAKQLMKLYEQLDDCGDTLNVFTNFEFSDEVLEALDS
ncbi:YebC/PmpR family DNA-binding transcriptional regulator [Haloferula sargassicola]|uniref:Probable transcriptional regulatory protein Hsar01_02740 n=1 Tax=Haloferula sargassicola TaxID=490096 RepID=A0ABP9UPY4_9BACT